ELCFRMTVEEVDRQLDVALDHQVDAGLRGHREVDADVVEQRSRRSREMTPVRPQPLHRPLAPTQNQLVIRLPLARVPLLQDVRAQLPVDGPAQVVNQSLSPTSICGAGWPTNNLH